MNTLIYTFTTVVVFLFCSCSSSRDFRSELLAAIDNGDIATIKRLADGGCDLSSPDKNGNRLTPLMWAIKYEQNNVIVYLLAKGIDVNQKNIDGETALNYAIYGGDDNIDLVKQLIKYGANVNQTNKMGVTILSEAKSQPPKPKLISILIGNGAHD